MLDKKKLNSVSLSLQIICYMLEYLLKHSKYTLSIKNITQSLFSFGQKSWFKSYINFPRTMTKTWIYLTSKHRCTHFNNDKECSRKINEAETTNFLFILFFVLQKFYYRAVFFYHRQINQSTHALYFIVVKFVITLKKR